MSHLTHRYVLFYLFIMGRTNLEYWGRCDKRRFGESGLVVWRCLPKLSVGDCSLAVGSLGQT